MARSAAPPTGVRIASPTVAAPYERIRKFMSAGWTRAEYSLVEARQLNELGHHAAAYVWAVRSAEILMRDFVLTPHFVELGYEWDKAMRKGFKVLGNSNWKRAFAKADEWYGPFDTLLTEDEEVAFDVWTAHIVQRRGELIHGAPVYEPDAEEAASAIAFAERMASWYAQRITLSERHPAGRAFREMLAALFEEKRQPDHVGNDGPDASSA